MKNKGIKPASKFLQHIFNSQDDSEIIECHAAIVTAEANEDVNFFLDKLDLIKSFCDKMKADIIKYKVDTINSKLIKNDKAKKK